VCEAGILYVGELLKKLGEPYIYGVATIGRLLKIIGLFCRISSLLQVSFTKETYNFKEPTNRSHPIPQTSRANSVQCYSTHQEKRESESERECAKLVSSM